MGGTQRPGTGDASLDPTTALDHADRLPLSAGNHNFRDRTRPRLRSLVDDDSGLKRRPWERAIDLGIEKGAW